MVSRAVRPVGGPERFLGYRERLQNVARGRDVAAEDDAAGAAVRGLFREAEVVIARLLLRARLKAADPALTAFCVSCGIPCESPDLDDSVLVPELRRAALQSWRTALPPRGQEAFAALMGLYPDRFTSDEAADAIVWAVLPEWWCPLVRDVELRHLLWFVAAYYGRSKSPPESWPTIAHRVKAMRRLPREARAVGERDLQTCYKRTLERLLGDLVKASVMAKFRRDAEQQARERLVASTRERAREAPSPGQDHAAEARGASPLVRLGRGLPPVAGAGAPRRTERPPGART